MSESCPTCRGRGTLPEVKVCALVDCGREFRWQDDGRGREHPREDSIYCSTSCQNVAAKRAHRQRTKDVRSSLATIA